MGRCVVDLYPPAARPTVETGVAKLARVARPARTERASDRVNDEISSAIRDMRLAPGAVLSETELALQLGVSRTPLREAIARLVDLGLLTVVSQVGTRVSLIDLAEVEEACFIRCALETAVFRRACETGARDVNVLRQILVRQEIAVATQDVEAFFASDEDLHQEIFRLGGHPDAWTVVRRSKLQLDRLRRLIIPAAIASRDLIEEHARIVDLLEAGDVEAGVRLITDHSGHVLRQAPDVRTRYPEYFTA